MVVSSRLQGESEGASRPEEAMQFVRIDENCVEFVSMGMKVNVTGIRTFKLILGAPTDLKTPYTLDSLHWYTILTVLCE